MCSDTEHNFEVKYNFKSPCISYIKVVFGRRLVARVNLNDNNTNSTRRRTISNIISYKLSLFLNHERCLWAII